MSAWFSEVLFDSSYVTIPFFSPATGWRYSAQSSPGQQGG